MDFEDSIFAILLWMTRPSMLAQILLGNLKQIIVKNQIFHPLMYNNTFYAGADFPRELQKNDLEDLFSVLFCRTIASMLAHVSPRHFKNTTWKSICLDGYVDPNPLEKWIFKICFSVRFSRARQSKQVLLLPIKFTLHGKYLFRWLRLLEPLKKMDLADPFF